MIKCFNYTMILKVAHHISVLRAQCNYVLNYYTKTITLLNLAALQQKNIVKYCNINVMQLYNSLRK